MNYNYRPAKIYMNKLEAKIKDLESRIDKAIEYIEKYGKTIEEIAYQNGTCEDSLQEILGILKGEKDEHTGMV